MFNYWSSFGQQATHINKDPLTITTLRFAGAVAFGSQAFNVANKHSDYDFAILRSNWKKLSENMIILNVRPIEDYFRVLPPYGKNTILREWFDGKYVDLLILEHQEHVNIIRKAVAKTKRSLNNDLLKNKQQRIHTFENALLFYGFKLTWKLRAIRWFAKVIKYDTKLWIPKG